MIDFVDPVTGEKRQIPVMLPKVGNIHTFIYLQNVFFRMKVKFLLALIGTAEFASFG
jgi:hypothetical protein